MFLVKLLPATVKITAKEYPALYSGPGKPKTSFHLMGLSLRLHSSGPSPPDVVEAQFQPLPHPLEKSKDDQGSEAGSDYLRSRPLRLLESREAERFTHSPLEETILQFRSRGCFPERSLLGVYGAARRSEERRRKKGEEGGPDPPSRHQERCPTFRPRRRATPAEGGRRALRDTLRTRLTAETGWRHASTLREPGTLAAQRPSFSIGIFSFRVLVRRLLWQRKPLAEAGHPMAPPPQGGGRAKPVRDTPAPPTQKLSREGFVK